MAGAAGLLLGTGIPAGAAPARPASVPGWRVIDKLGPSTGDWGVTFIALGATDAWSTWNAVGHSLVEHWNGSAWKSVPYPASMASNVQSVTAIAGKSARNIWLFSDGDKAMRWNGHNWHLQTMPQWVVHFNLAGEVDVQSAVFGNGNVWVFSLGTDAFKNPDHYAAHYNGHVWTKVQLPAVPISISALSPNDIWAAGAPLNNALGRLFMHWNGKRWSTLALPKVTVPKGDIEFVLGPSALGSENLWAQLAVQPVSGGPATLYLEHWNGKHWGRVGLKYPTSGIDSIASDGHGGIWLHGIGPKPALTEYFEHRNSAGQWSRSAVPADMSIQPPGLSWIPGTRSLWATGDLFSGQVIYGAILKFGA